MADLFSLITPVTLLTIVATFVIHGFEMRRRNSQLQDMARRRQGTDDFHAF
jgi:hypothetical protein